MYRRCVEAVGIREESHYYFYSRRQAKFSFLSSLLLSVNIFSLKLFTCLEELELRSSLSFGCSAVFDVFYIEVKATAITAAKPAPNWCGPLLVQCGRGLSCLAARCSCYCTAAW
jgi:hypothetical protein